jgi:hypothetical protein
MKRFVGRRLSILAGIVLTPVLLVTAARAQSSSEERLKITPSTVDRAAAEESTVVYRHARPANTPAGANLKRETAQAPRANGSSGGSNGPFRFPGDLSYLGGQVVESAQSHAIYLLPNGTCPIASCWGNPEGFLRDLGRSEFIHVTDQYIGVFASNRYTVGGSVSIGYAPPKVPLTDNDMLAVVHAVASATGQTGYGHIFHVFLPPGQDECFTSADTECYSPDNPNTFAFCAYHSSVDFKDIGHVLYTVEPFQNVGGCSVKPGTPNGQLIDSTNNSLSHETFETITDPDGDAWINFSLVVLAGAEIGDECSFFTVIGQNVYFDPLTFRIGRNAYAAQPEYSNRDHDCATAP